MIRVEARSSDPAPVGTVLLVDDEPTVLRAFERILAGNGYAVESCLTAHGALQRVAQGGVEVVVSDVSMPELSGIELLRTIRAHDPDLPVVLATGLPAMGSAVEAVEYGAFKYLVKPI